MGKDTSCGCGSSERSLTGNLRRPAHRTDLLVSFSSLALAALIAVAVSPGSGGPEACKTAFERYKRTKAEVEAAVQVFAECIASKRVSSCAPEFDELEAVEVRFEAAAGDYQEACP